MQPVLFTYLPVLSMQPTALDHHAQVILHPIQVYGVLDSNGDVRMQDFHYFEVVGIIPYPLGGTRRIQHIHLGGKK